MNQSGVYMVPKPVMADVFPLVGTHGVPLEIILDFFKEREMVMDWPDYIRGALKDGHNPRTIKARITSAVGDVYGASYRDAVEERLNIIFNQSKDRGDL